MKIRKHTLINLTAGLVLSSMIVASCTKEFLERTPVGQISEVELNSREGVQGLLIAAYSLLDGMGAGDGQGIDAANTSVWNAWAGSVAADDAHKGGGNGSQGERAELQNRTYISDNPILVQRWRMYYAGVQRANDVLRQLEKLPEGEMTESEKTQVTAEARFLRGIYHYEAAKMFWNIPYIDETITAGDENFRVSNSSDPSNPTGWDGLIADFEFAASNLPPTQPQFGRGHSWAAKAFLAKAYMQQANLEAAKPILEDIIMNGTNAAGTKLALHPKYNELFRPGSENTSETVFSVQMSVNDGAFGRAGNEGESFNYPPNWVVTPAMPGAGGWGHQPSFNLANAYKTPGGLPDLENFNDVDIKNSFNLGLADGAPFDTHDGPLDPRIDWTIGRRGIPLHDWGVVIGEPYPDNGPYFGKKWIAYKSELDGSDGGEFVDGWKINSGINYPMIRFADILLLAAEAEVEIGSIEKAREYVNLVRERAANPEGFLTTYNNPADPASGFSTNPAANYVVAEYTNFPSEAYARMAVRHERRIELGTEGHRFFDLQRYDRIDEKYGNETGYMARILNDYRQSEAAKFAAYGRPHGYLPGVQFQNDVHEVFAIPQSQRDLSKEGDTFTLTQNPGFSN